MLPAMSMILSLVLKTKNWGGGCECECCVCVWSYWCGGGSSSEETGRQEWKRTSHHPCWYSMKDLPPVSVQSAISLPVPAPVIIRSPISCPRVRTVSCIPHSHIPGHDGARQAEFTIVLAWRFCYSCVQNGWCLIFMWVHFSQAYRSLFGLYPAIPPVHSIFAPQTCVLTFGVVNGHESLKNNAPMVTKFSRIFPYHDWLILLFIKSLL